jgi:hypothetical protein
MMRYFGLGYLDSTSLHLKLSLDATIEAQNLLCTCLRSRALRILGSIACTHRSCLLRRCPLSDSEKKPGGTDQTDKRDAELLCA